MSNESFFLDKGVVKSCGVHIENVFETLILRNREKPFEWYQKLGLDKSYGSRIRRGLIIPPVWLRIKIAHHFNTDSSTIWKVEDLLEIQKDIMKKEEFNDQ